MLPRRHAESLATNKVSRMVLIRRRNDGTIRGREGTTAIRVSVMESSTGVLATSIRATEFSVGITGVAASTAIFHGGLVRADRIATRLRVCQANMTTGTAVSHFGGNVHAGGDGWVENIRAADVGVSTGIAASATVGHGLKRFAGMVVRERQLARRIVTTHRTGSTGAFATAERVGVVDLSTDAIATEHVGESVSFSTICAGGTAIVPVCQRVATSEGGRDSSLRESDCRTAAIRIWSGASIATRIAIGEGTEGNAAVVGRTSTERATDSRRERIGISAIHVAGTAKVLVSKILTSETSGLGSVYATV